MRRRAALIVPMAAMVALLMHAPAAHAARTPPGGVGPPVSAPGGTTNTSGSTGSSGQPSSNSGRTSQPSTTLVTNPPATTVTTPSGGGPSPSQPVPTLLPSGSGSGGGTSSGATGRAWYLAGWSIGTVSGVALLLLVLGLWGLVVRPRREGSFSAPPPRFCGGCGAERVPGAVYCPQCGALYQQGGTAGPADVGVGGRRFPGPRRAAAMVLAGILLGGSAGVLAVRAASPGSATDIAHEQLVALLKMPELTSSDLPTVLAWEQKLTAILRTIDSDPAVLAAFKAELDAGGQIDLTAMRTPYDPVLADSQSDHVQELEREVNAARSSSAMSSFLDRAYGALTKWTGSALQSVVQRLAYSSQAVEQSGGAQNWVNGRDQQLDSQVTQINNVFPPRGKCDPGYSEDSTTGNCKLLAQTWTFHFKGGSLSVVCGPKGTCTNPAAGTANCRASLSNVYFAAYSVSFNASQT